MKTDLFEMYVAHKKALRPEQRRDLAIVALQADRYVGQELIGKAPVEDVLTEGERRILEEELATPEPVHTAPHSDFVAVTKLTRLCNLRCTYCHSWAEGPGQTMMWRTMIRTVRSILSMQDLQRAQFVWHGGEVTLLKPKFMKKLIWLQQRLKRQGQAVANALQTNATLLSDEWIDFLIGLDINVGISIDGPTEINDLRRVYKNKEGSTQDVLAGVQALRAAGIPFGALIVVDHSIVEFGAKRILDFALEAGIEAMTLLNSLPENTAPHGKPENYLPYPDYVSFLCEMFDVWWPNYVNQITFTDLAQLQGGVSGERRPVSCLWSGDCHSRFMTVEANGDLAPCDKYRGDAGSLLGNVTMVPVGDLINKSNYLRDAKELQREANRQMSACKYFRVCRGGCPHDRLLSTRHLPDFDGSCCGLHPLLAKMEEASMHRSTKLDHAVVPSLATT